MKRLLPTKSLLLFLTVVMSAWMACVRAQPQKTLPTPEGSERAKQGKSTPQREELPSDLKCPSDYHPTVWEGKVTSFKRNGHQTEIAVHADWDADYSGVIRHPDSEEPPLDLFRLKGKPFRQIDWTSVEIERNKLKPDVRAKVWVCADKMGKDPIIKRIDWLGENNRSKATP
jgi:hypothetical protein